VPYSASVFQPIRLSSCFRELYVSVVTPKAALESKPSMVQTGAVIPEMGNLRKTVKRSSSNVQTLMHRIERREWLLWAFAILVTLLLTAAVVSFIFPLLHEHVEEFDELHLSLAVRGLVGLVLLFDVYTIYQQLQIYRIRHALVHHEQLFRLISEHAADMIAVVDASGKRLYNSPSYERILGYTVEELQSTSSLDQVHPDDRALVEEAAREIDSGSPGRAIQYRMRGKDGTWHVLESRSSPVLDAAGNVEKLVIVNRDVTERKHLEEQFRQSQKMEAVGRLSGGVAHDFNNLLGVIIGYAEFLQESIEPDNPIRGSADEILKAGKRAASLTRQLLAFSRQQVLDPKVIDLNSAVADMEKLLRRLIGEDIELATKLPPDLGRVKADQGQLEQVILNLAVNARDAMPQGGKLIITTENFAMDEAFVRRYPYPVQPGPYVCLTVTDTGIGMDAETKARAFEPFFTTKEKGKGTGLGLSTVYGVVKQSGGYIDIESTVNVGTTFKIYLPRVDEAIHAPGPVSDANGSLSGKETILLVEDEGSLRTLTRTSLELLGYKVLEAKDGIEALDVSDHYEHGVDLLLTDMVMPGMGGRALAEELSRRRPETKLIYMSGYTGQSVGEKGPIGPGSDFLMKPFTRETLARKVRDVLNRGVLVGSK
jgi:two-component system, cell cycle sensor histidine kinase and response regulator CckA